MFALSQRKSEKREWVVKYLTILPYIPAFKRVDLVKCLSCKLFWGIYIENVSHQSKLVLF